MVIYRVLIVCEGEKTEPNYFKSFNQIRKGGVVFEVDCEGKGFNTRKVVEEAIRLRDKAKEENKPYDSVWAVFDRDSFKPHQFNGAIQKAKESGIRCAWSNEAFELWYINHFEYRDTPMSRKDYQSKITSLISRKEKGFRYRKNDKEMRRRLLNYGSEELAIQYSKKQEKAFNDERYADHNPETHVYELVELLTGKDKHFNEYLRNDLSKE